MNFVLIMADDMGYWSMGCEGCGEAVTPNIDQLAERGVRFSRFYCASPVCSPARASLLTGRMPSYHGVADWIRKGNVDDGRDKPIPYMQNLKGYPEYLAEAGYDCAISGKWHLGDSCTPQMGFEHWYVHQSGGGRYYNAPMVRDGKRVEEAGYVTDRITEDAVDFLAAEERKQKPFYLHVAYTAPHTPWLNNHPQELLDLFADSDFPSCPIQPRHPWQIDFPLFEGDRNKNLQGYFAAVAGMDAGIGRIMHAIEDNGLGDNTMVVFTSDNGFNCGHHGVWGKGNGTFPFNMYESSVRVPFIVFLPGIRSAGRVDNLLTSAYDWFPTILELAGIQPAETDLPGTSFATLLRGEGTGPQDRPIYIYDEYGDTRMVLDGGYKYVCRHGTGEDELFDLQLDPGEQNNIIREPAGRVIAERMHGEMREWFAKHTKSEADAIGAHVKGWGQDRKYTTEGYPSDAFAQG